MKTDFQNHILKNLQFLQGKKLLLATSGGIDSMVLSELLLISGFEITLAHCNFNLRGNESDEDEAFVTNYAKNHNLKIHISNFDTNAFAKDNKLSTQVAARQLRYMWFNEVLEQNNLDYIITAHHADDNLETFLINFSRGTGLEGLTGIPQQNGKIIRPLLPFSRAQIENFASENQIKWREDSSNASDKYLRNKIRHDVVPILKSLNPNFLQSFQETSNHLQQAKSMVEDASNLVYKEVVIEKEDKIIFKIYELKRLDNYQAYLYHWLKDFGFTAWNDIYDLPDAQSGKQIFSRDYSLLKDREILILQPISEEDSAIYEISKDTKSLNFPINLSLDIVKAMADANHNCIFVDLEKLSFPLQLRKWREGDYFYPFGMEGKKKVSKFFKDEKLSLHDKSDVWMLTSNEEIVWIVARRLDDRFKVTDKTTTILHITKS